MDSLSRFVYNTRPSLSLNRFDVLNFLPIEDTDIVKKKFKLSHKKFLTGVFMQFIMSQINIYVYNYVGCILYIRNIQVVIVRFVPSSYDTL